MLPWRWIPLPTTAFVLRADGPVDYRWVALEEISPALALSVVAAEDQKFPDHGGFDYVAIREAALERRERRRGASTISQQVAKNVYLWPGRSLVRKGIEAYLTVWIEALWPKRRILEVYLNVAEFGPGVYGAEAAAQRYFARSAGELGPREAALLAAVLPNPRRMSAAQPSEYVRGRAAEIASAVRRLGPRHLAGLR